MSAARRLLALWVVLFAASVADRAAAADLSGCWEGRWESCTTGHNGLLRATFTRLDDTRYQVDFSGRFFKLLPFRYSVVLQVVEDQGDTVVLSGSSYLGRLVGTFSYTATATDCKFVAKYCSCKGDWGYFRLCKVSSCCG